MKLYLYNIYRDLIDVEIRVRFLYFYNLVFIYSKKVDWYLIIKKFIKRVMRIGCFLNMRNIYFWRRKSKKNEKVVMKVNEFLKLILVKDEDKLKEIEEFWLGEYVDSKL